MVGFPYDKCQKKAVTVIIIITIIIMIIIMIITIIIIMKIIIIAFCSLELIKLLLDYKKILFYSKRLQLNTYIL